MELFRSSILKTLQPSSYRMLWGAWIVVIVMAATICFWPAFVAPQGAPQSSVSLDAADRQALRASTQAEVEMIRRLPMLLQPMPSGFPPPQAQPPRASPALFGLRDEQRLAFARVLDSLAEALPECTQRLAGARTVPAALADARPALAEVTELSTQERGFLSYHQGLIDLCSGDPGEAQSEFESALADFEDHRNTAQNPSDEDLRLLSQYEMVASYGRGLAILAAGGRTSQADQAFNTALEAGARSVASDQAGPFVELRGASDGNSAALFEFSSAEIYNARLAAWMADGRAAEGFERVRERLAHSPGYVSAHPTLSANLAASAATAGEFATPEELFRAASNLMRQASGEAPAEAQDQAAWSRLAALAVVAPQSIYSDGDPWPLGAQTSTRRNFENRYDEDESWFPPIALGTDDAAIIDRWLWIRRQRNLLETGQFEAFRTDGVAVHNLGSDSREFIEGWREEITGDLAWALLMRAERVRRSEGLDDAKPLLALVGSRGFPPQHQFLARMAYRHDAPVIGTVAWGISVVLIVLLLAWAHIQLATGYIRTFGARHHEDRARLRRAFADGRPAMDPSDTE
ncbi:MAG: hypothetical protein J0L52_09235 [Caulobacterales bacterium]|nr:hypothetical protein [Caulobacterales bacterium]